MNHIRAAKGITLVALLIVPLLVAAQAKRPDDIWYPALREFDIPQPTRVELPNGLVLMLLEDHELPLISGTVLVRAGSVLEPEDKIGLASLTGTVLRTGGTTTRTPDEIDDFLENRAASIETSIGTSSGSASVSALKEDFPEVLALLVDILRNPGFDEGRLMVAKNQVNSMIARQNDNPLGIMFREFTEVIYGPESPYARGPDYASVANISRDDLIAFHQSYFHPNNFVMGLVGDFDTDGMVQMVSEAFADWEAGPEAPSLVGDYRKHVEPAIYYIRKEDMTQSDIAIGHLGIRQDNPHYFAVQLLNEVFSGGFASRLFSRIRSQEGLAYSVRGSVGSSWDHEGIFRMWMTTKVDTTGAGIEALIREAKNLMLEPPTEQEVDQARESILNSFVFNSDSPSKTLGQQLLFEYQDYPLDWLDRYQEAIRTTTLEDVRLAAKKHIDPDKFAIMVVGPSEGHDRPLTDFGPVSEIDISIAPPPGQ